MVQIPAEKPPIFQVKTRIKLERQKFGLIVFNVQEFKWHSLSFHLRQANLLLYCILQFIIFWWAPYRRRRYSKALNKREKQQKEQ